METKEKIIYEALNLFSVQGYNAVSIRDIGKAVGIKESSIYNHFKNKQDLFDSIVKTCEEKSRAFYEAIEIPYDINDTKINMYENIKEEQLFQISLAICSYFFNDEYAVKFRRLLVIEQFNNPEIQKTYREAYIESALRFQSVIFKKLMDAGIFKKGNPDYVARAFYAPMFLLINEYDVFTDEVKEKVVEHIKEFSTHYGQGSCEK